jgi:hypothetical protein
MRNANRVDPICGHPSEIFLDGFRSVILSVVRARSEGAVHDALDIKFFIVQKEKLSPDAGARRGSWAYLRRTAFLFGEAGFISA